MPRKNIYIYFMSGRNTSSLASFPPDKNHSLVDKYWENQLRFYPPDRDFSSGKFYSYPLELGSCRRQVLASNRKGRLYRAYQVYRVYWVYRTITRTLSPTITLTLIDARLGPRLPRGRANWGPYSRDSTADCRLIWPLTRYLQCYCTRKTLATGRYPTYIPEKVDLREAIP